MNRLIRFYNQNRYMIWISILILIAIITIIQILNKFAFEKKYEEDSSSENKIVATTINKNYSVITGKEVNSEVSDIIEQFIDYCNNKEIEKAYELLSEDCKETLYPSVKDFQQKYYNNIFTEKKSYLYQAWIEGNQSYTYKVDFVDDMLATGEASKTSISDYYTVVKNNNRYELNINKFIGIVNINTAQELNKIKIDVIRKRVYMNYEIYELAISNALNNEIKLDNLKKTKTVYLEDENEQKYYWYSHEMLEDDVLIRNGERKNIEIKFNKEYQPKIEIQRVVFSKIMINDIQSIEVSILLK